GRAQAGVRARVAAMTPATRTMTAPGTSLATSAGVSESHRHTDVWRGRRNYFFLEEARTVSRWAMAMGALVHAATLTIFAVSDYPRCRVALPAALCVVFTAAQRAFISRARRHKNIEPSFIGLSLCAQVFVVSCAILTGGLYSPFAPSLALPSIVT